MHITINDKEITSRHFCVAVNLAWLIPVVIMFPIEFFLVVLGVPVIFLVGWTALELADYTTEREAEKERKRWESIHSKLQANDEE